MKNLTFFTILLSITTSSLLSIAESSKSIVKNTKENNSSGPPYYFLSSIELNSLSKVKQESYLKSILSVIQGISSERKAFDFQKLKNISENSKQWGKLENEIISYCKETHSLKDSELILLKNVPKEKSKYCNNLFEFRIRSIATED